MTYSNEQYARYRTEKGKEAIKRYEASAKGRERKRRYLASPKGQAASRARNAERKRINREIVVIAKAKPCADCGGRFDTICMDFHHVRGEKRYTIGWGRHTAAMLRKEIAKCVVLCSNCHRLRHKKRGARYVTRAENEEHPMAKTLTLRDVDEKLMQRAKVRAAEMGISLRELVLRAIGETVGKGK